MSRRNGSVSRAAETASKNRLHMDRNPQHSRITDGKIRRPNPSNPAGRRKELDNVMKRARQASPGSWDRKLLEVEEKDPNRWRHTGYKQLYVDGAGSASPRRSRSPPQRRSRSPIARRSRSPVGRRSRSPIGRRSRSPVLRRSRSRSLRRVDKGGPRRSPPRRSPVGRSVQRRSSRPRSPPPRRESPRARVRPRPPPPSRPNRPPSPPTRKSSPTGSSLSSCSDESCSVCSAKNKKPSRPPPKPKPGTKAPAPPKPNKPGAPAVAPSKRLPPPSSTRAVQPTRELLKAREASKRSREEKVLEWQRSQIAANRAPAAPIPTTNIKREGERRPAQSAPPRPRREERGVSPGAIAAALNDSGSDSESDTSSEPAPQRLTLSERFGKMAQWSADRSARLENMRITRRDATLHVHIDSNERESPPTMEYPGLEAAPVGSYPEELLAVAPGGLPSWDDVRVRYDYYKKRGYLRGLTLGDYVKWEEWWYKYQEWLKRERAYERWADADQSSVRRERRRRGGRHRRS
ncbi:serine/arginine repetitive matrix protein 1 isoform X2 [Hyposmocoma kahamanoa]|uniref:serine/arginine repetitive matrix protein 1 isoform X2 n=1 Tax=Hyposmocoma kahamanoa TaxID=1477025 RepID=UPI000E6D8BFB|nr:serine/arginine repetitive matrix protein 1 isoform X2 [Hyposmocoma kahamanoa]